MKHCCLPRKDTSCAPHWPAFGTPEGRMVRQTARLPAGDGSSRSVPLRRHAVPGRPRAAPDVWPGAPQTGGRGDTSGAEISAGRAARPGSTPHTLRVLLPAMFWGEMEKSLEVCFRISAPFSEMYTRYSESEYTGRDLRGTAEK
ncbi:hypothetical protein AAFF_G00107890 [Aldrovandia affinis]|uniref:Uncharacterized protein n=1 Tax=Aldrovandia affinis TaxID=143900 RepID=A0AAD7RUD6_9TELE|nr:hypothetical protein AAFF_G00107890 [Aldrovandia affinis]